MSNAQKYANQAMLVTLSISKWSASKTDKSVTEDVISQNGAEHGAGRFTKRLISKNDADLKAINSAASQLRLFHRSLTMPWDNNGRDLLPAKAFLKYKSKMTELENAYYLAVDNFISGYNLKVRTAQATLGHMFNIDDYPMEDDIRACYGVDLKVEPVPLGANLKVGISQQFLDEEREKIEASVLERVRSAHKTLYQRLQKVAGNVIELMSRDEANFKSTFITNVMETANLLEMLDLEDDGQLQDSARKLKEAVNRYGYHRLKEDEEARKEVKEDAQAQLERLKKAVDQMA